jgi:hypothetical protein
MKGLYKFFGIIVLSIFIFSACNENISDPQTVSNDQKSLAKQINTEKAQQIAKVMAANNLGQGAYFIETTGSGYGIGIGKNITFECNENGCFFSGGQLAFFDGSFGKGDFMRRNPDGTVSVKLSTNQANASLFDFGTGEYYAGTGNMNSKFTGTIEEFCFEPEPGVQICFSFLIEDPNINAWILHGNAPVTLNGLGEDPHRLQMFVNLNPGGPGKFDFTFN